jgi:DNA-directed RNA polymerase specialized sigma24 family protein
MQRDLVARAREGDHDAFTSLVAVSIDSLYSTARLILRSDDLAEDAVQDALSRAWLGIRSLRDPDRNVPGAYLPPSEPGAPHRTLREWRACSLGV